MMNAPAEVMPKQLKELGIKIVAAPASDAPAKPDLVKEES